MDRPVLPLCWVSLCLVALVSYACAGSKAVPSTPTTSADVPVAYTYEVVHTYPHDPEAYTQGLVYADGVLYESTGLYGQSSLRKVALETGHVLQERSLPAGLFGEGLTFHNGRLIQLTWKANTGFVYDRETFQLLGQFTYPTEGWGITHDGTHLIMSDGSATLRFLDAETFAEVRTLDVYGPSGPVTMLNELEYVNGEIYANVWQTDRIARIAPDTGRVTGWIDLTGLLALEDRTETTDVLNGIAYDQDNGRLFVTGKLWPKLFEIRLIVEPNEGG